MAFRMHFNGKETPPSQVPALGTVTPVGVWVVTETCASEVTEVFERSRVTTSSQRFIRGVDAGPFDVFMSRESVDSVGVAQSKDADSTGGERAIAGH